jgi:hypothetical protein
MSKCSTIDCNSAAEKLPELSEEENYCLDCCILNLGGGDE